MINCKKCGAVIPDGLDNCLICGTKSGELPLLAHQLYDAEFSAAPAAKAAAKRHPKAMSRVLVFAGLLIALAAAAVLAAQIIPNYFGTPGMYRAKNALIYTTGDGSLKFISPSAEQPEILSGGFERFSITDAKTSPNGRYVAYLKREGGSAALYLRDLAAIAPLAQNETRDAEMISEAKSFIFVESNSHIIYLTESGGLYYYDFTQSVPLDKDTGEILDCRDGRILYTGKGGSGSGGSVSTLYVGEYSAGAYSRAIVADDVAELIDYTPAFDRFIFTVRSDSASGTASDIAAVDMAQRTRHTLATGAEKVVAADAKSFTALYQTSYDNPLHYDNIINDDLAREDDKVKEPDIDDYPLLKEFYEKYGIDAEYEGSKDYEDIAEEDAKLDKAIAAYDKMRANEALRQRILSEIDEYIEEYPTLYDLYLYRDGNVTRISESSYSPFDDAKLDVQNNVASWRETNFTSFEKIVFSRFPEGAKIPELLSAKLTDKLYLKAFGQNAVQIKLNQSDKGFTFADWQLTGTADGVYFAVSEGAPPVPERNRAFSAGGYLPLECTLYYYRTGSNADIDGHIIAIDNNVFALGEMLGGDKLLYYKDISGDTCDLYMLAGTSADSAGQRIGENVSLRGEHFKIVNDGKTLLFCERFNEKSKSGNLFMYTNQNRQLATDVNNIYYRNDQLVYFTRNLNNGKADLYSFGQNGLVLLDTDVTAVPEGPAFTPSGPRN